MYKIFVCLMVFIITGVLQMYGQDWKSKYYHLQQRIEQKRLSRKNIHQDTEKLGKEWNSMQLDSAELPPQSEPKPVNPIKYVPGQSQQPITPKELQGTPVEIQRRDTTAYQLKSKGLRINVEEGFPEFETAQMVSFFGRNIPLREIAGADLSLIGQLSPSKISGSWSKLSESKMDLQILDLLRVSYHMGLNDWGYCLLVNEVARYMYPRDMNAQTLYNLYALVQAGYEAKIGQNNSSLYLMIPTKERIYGHTFLTRGSTRYYVVDLNGTTPSLNQAHVLDLSFPHTDDVISFAITNPLKLGTELQRRRYTFSYGGTSYSLEATLDRQMVRFYDTYPFTDWHIQLSAPMSPYVHRTLITDLKHLAKGRTEADAANMMLRFVQQAFPYKTDSEQFGGENYLFAEEMLFYPYSDCEDRSALYAYLVREVLGLEVMGLLFPGHAAVAVKFSRPVEGSYVTYKGKRFTICDPTYVNADIGQYAPQVIGKDVRIIAFSN